MNALGQGIENGRSRCSWCLGSPEMVHYHDAEWGVPLHDDALHFEYLVLDSFQAGLSWRTILHKRENFRRALHGFDAERIARYGANDVERLLADAGIVRHRRKIEATITNARAFLDLRERAGSFDAFVWAFVDGRPLQNRWRAMGEVPSKTVRSDALSRALVAEGFRFVGSTTCYAYMQAAGLVNDHIVDCFRHDRVGASPRLPLEAVPVGTQNGARPRSRRASVPAR